MPRLATCDNYLLAREDTIDPLILAFKIHSIQYLQPTKEQFHKQKLLDAACISLQKMIENLVGRNLGESIRKCDKYYRKARHYTDVLTATTQETISLINRIRVIEHKLNPLLERPFYASVIQKYVLSISRQPVVQSLFTPVEDTCFIVEIENPISNDFNVLNLWEKLNNLLSLHASWFTAICRSHNASAKISVCV